jgi:hypothetical protein
VQVECCLFSRGEPPDCSHVQRFCAGLYDEKRSETVNLGDELLDEELRAVI